MKGKNIAFLLGVLLLIGGSVSVYALRTTMASNVTDSSSVPTESLYVGVDTNGEPYSVLVTEASSEENTAEIRKQQEAATRSNFTREEEAAHKAQEEKASKELAETAEQLSALFYQEQRDPDAKSILENYISLCRNDLVWLQDAYEDYKKENNVTEERTYEEELAKTRARISAYESVLYALENGKISKEEAYKQCQDIHFDAVVGFDVYENMR